MVRTRIFPSVCEEMPAVAREFVILCPSDWSVELVPMLEGNPAAGVVDGWPFGLCAVAEVSVWLEEPAVPVPVTLWPEVPTPRLD